MSSKYPVDFVALGKRAIKLEADAVRDLGQRLADDFSRSCDLLLSCTGRVVVCGVGKSGHIARKLAATFASTGTPAFFLHPTEAGHGDMGMVVNDDVLLAISYSGEATEIVTLLPIFKKRNISIIAMSGNRNSSLANNADIFLDISVAKEACPLDLAPTSSTTVTLVLGDALAVAMLEARGFDHKDFAQSHPSGLLGRRLLLKVQDLMADKALLPCVVKTAYVADALVEMNRCGFGMTAVVDAKGKLCGVFTDGDLRRTFNQRLDVHKITIEECMSCDVKTTKADILGVEVLKMMEQHKISAVVCVDDNYKPVGVVHFLALLQAGLK